MLFEVRTFKQRVEICDELFLSKICHIKGLEGKDESFKNFECFLESFFQKTHSF